MSDNNTETLTLDHIAMPDSQVVDYIISNTKHVDRLFVEASIIAHRYDDPKVPSDIKHLLDSTFVHN